MHESIQLFDQEIKTSGAKTVLYMTWARLHQWDRQSELGEAYLSIGRAIGAIVIPVGTVWQQFLLNRPELVLHEKDNSHPNLAGTYLAACVFYAKLFKQSPEGLNTSDQAALGRFGPGTGQLLQRAAWQGVKGK